MAGGDLIKELAQQALGNPVKGVLDALRPGDLTQVSESMQQNRPAGASPAESLCGAILGQIQAMQKSLKPDDELVVLVNCGAETIRVLEVFVPVWSLMVLTGIDTERNLTRVVSPVDRVQLVCKIVKVQAGAKPARVNIVAPRPKAD